MITWGHMTNWKLNISSLARSMTTKHGWLVTYGERNPPMESHDLRTTWWFVVTWQIKSVTYSLWQGLKPQNLVSWWLTVRWTHPWSHMSLWPTGHMRSRDKAKTKYFFHQKMYGHQTLHGAEYVEMKPVVKLHDSDQVITRRRMSNWKLKISSSTKPIPPDLTGWRRMVTGSHPWSHTSLWLCGLAKSHEKFKTYYPVFCKVYGSKA